MAQLPDLPPPTIRGPLPLLLIAGLLLMLLLQQAVGGLPGLSLQQSEKTTVVSVAVSSSEADAPLDSADGAPLDSADDDDDASASEEGAEPPSDLEAALDEEAVGEEEE